MHAPDRGAIQHENTVLNIALLNLWTCAGIKTHIIVCLYDGLITQLRCLEHDPAAAGVSLTIVPIMVVIGGNTADTVVH